MRLYKGDIVYRGKSMHWGLPVSELIFVIEKTKLKIDKNDNGEWMIFHTPLRNRIKRLLKL